IFTTVSGTAPLVRDGKLRALVVMSRVRASALPDVPTTGEAGLAGLESDTFQGALVPAGTPGVVVDQLHREIAAIARMPAVQDRFAALGFEIVASTPRQFADAIREQVAQWGKVIRDANIRVE